MSAKSNSERDNRPINLMSDDELRMELSFTKDLLSSSVNDNTPDDLRLSKLESRQEELEEEMGRRGLDYYPNLEANTSTVVQPLAATYLDPSGDNYKRPDGHKYLRPQQESLDSTNIVTTLVEDLTQGTLSSDAEPHFKSLWEIRDQYQLTQESLEFIEWVASEGTRLNARGAIGTASLHAFFAAWVHARDPFLAKIFDEEFKDNQQVATSIALGLLEPYKTTPSTSGFPYVTVATEEVFAEAQKLAGSPDEDIAPQHIYAGLLSWTTKFGDPAVHLQYKPDRFARLIKAFLMTLKEQGFVTLADRLGKIVDQSKDSGSSKAPPRQATGSRFNLSREATVDELCLNINAYGEVIAETILAAAEDDDFVLALYGPWGRGKTTQMREVATILEGNPARNLPGSGYKCQFFSAWKYPTRPEVWVHLYQCLAAAAQEGSVQKLRIGFRVGLLKKGWWPLWTGFFLFALSRIQIDIANWIFNGVGIIGILILGSFVWSAIKLGKGITDSYAGIPNHADKLGLQAVIGYDLKCLLRVWTAKPEYSSVTKTESDYCDFPLHKTWWRLLIICILGLLTLAFVGFKVGDTASAIGGWQLIVTHGLLISVAIAFLSLAVVLASPPHQPKRILLVVDDLDRCEPEQMLAVIESIRLFLDDPQMSRRMKVVMLMDKVILEQVLLKRCYKKKFEPVSENSSEEHALDIHMRRYLLSKREKFFVAELTLPNLALDDVKNISVSIVDREYRAQMQKAEIEASEKDDIDKEQFQEMREKRIDTAEQVSSFSGGSVGSQKTVGHNSSNNSKPDVNTTFASWERDALKKAIQSHFRDDPTPRSIRAFVLRYQLARLLLQRLKYDGDIDKLADALAEALQADPAKVFVDTPSHLRWAVTHVI